MKITLDDVSGLPEALKTLVSENEGKHELDLTTLAPASELDKYKGKALTAEQEAIERRQALKAWKDLGESPDAVKEAIANAGKGNNADHEKIIADMKAAHQAELEAAQGKLSGLYQRTAQESLKAELAKAGVISEGLDLLANFAASRIQFGDDGTPRVLAADGKTPMVGNAANGGATLADLAGELAKTIPHLVKDAGKGGGGKPAGSQGGTPAKTVTRAEWDQMGHSDRATFSKDGGKVVD